MRVENIIVAYFLIGAVLWAGGAVPWVEAGVGESFVNASDGDNVTVEEDREDELDQGSGTFADIVESTVGVVVGVVNVLSGLVGYLFWPISTLNSAGAPVELVVLLGGTPTVAFFMSVLRFVRG